MRAAAKVVDSRVILRLDMGLYIGTKMWTLPGSSYRIQVLVAYQTY